MRHCVLSLVILTVSLFGGERFFIRPAAAQTTRVLTLSETDDGRRIRLKKGDRLVIKLKAQFGTGYNWQLAANDQRRLAPTGQSVDPPGKNDESGFETQTFRFRAKRNGEFELAFFYRRVWEKGVAPLKKIRLRIQIGDSRK